MKKIVIGILCVIFLSSFLYSADREIRISPSIFQEGEVLNYKVKWSFLQVGTLKLINEGQVDYEGKDLYLIRIFIDSNPKIPFVTIHDQYYVYVDNQSQPYYFVALEKKSGFVLKTEYKFSYKDRHIYLKVQKLMENGEAVLVEERSTLMEDVYRDVLSLLYFARGLSAKKINGLQLPTFVVTGKDSCYFEVAGDIHQEKVNGERVPAYYLAGRVKFIGIAGIKDDFKGWFSIDARHVPLKAKMKAFFGSITLELESVENWDGHPLFYADLVEKMKKK